MTPTTRATPADAARAWGWVRHLREGGTTPWASWSAAGEPVGRAVPGAQQLELLRRLNQAGRPTAGLVDRVLTASAPGRGQPDLELAGAAPESAFGPRPVDPAHLPNRELLRVAVALIAEDLVAAGVPPAPRPGTTRPWRRRYRLVGDPELADPLREQLLARGRPPGGRSARVYVMAAPLDRMLADAWTRRSFDIGAPSWRAWLDQVVRDGRLPARADTLRQARGWAARVGRDRVTVVTDLDGLPALLGVRRLVPPAPTAAEVPDLARRVAPALGLLVPSAERGALLRRTLRPRIAAGLPAGVRPLTVPPEHRDWVDAQAGRVADGLSRAGYAVQGEPGALRPVRAPAHAGVTAPDDTATLRLALRLILGEEATR